MTPSSNPAPDSHQPSAAELGHGADDFRLRMAVIDCEMEAALDKTRDRYGRTVHADAAEAARAHRDTCSGKDLIAMGCDNDAEILQQATMPDESVSIRLLWSPMCQDVWAKVSRDLDTSPASVYLTLWTTRDPDGGVQAGDSSGVLGSGVAGAYTTMRNWKKTTAKACWNDVDTAFDPAPAKYTIQSPAKQNDWPVDASLVVQHGSCTDWM